MGLVSKLVHKSVGRAVGRGWTGDKEYQVVSMLCLSVKCHAMGCIPIYLFIELMKVSRYGVVCLMPELSPQLFPRCVGLVSDHAACSHDETGTCPCTWFGDGVGWWGIGYWDRHTLDKVWEGGCTST